MIRPAVTLLALLGAAPAWAQNEPFRIVNGARLPATALYLVRSGQEDWGRNLLSRGPLAPGAALSMRPPEGAGCHFDIRLTLQDGEEATRRNADVCANRIVAVGEGAGATAPAPAPARPAQASDGAPPQAGQRE